MAFDLKIDQKRGDLVPGIVSGHDEIIQRLYTRLQRHLGEWFVNTSCGLPWYSGLSTIMPGKLTERGAILGGRNLRYTDLWIRNEIAETDGILEVVEFNTFFEAEARKYSVYSKIITVFGYPEVVKLGRILDRRYTLDAQ